MRKQAYMNWKLFALAMVLMTSSITASAQDSRSVIRDQISEWGSCRNVTLTMTGGDLALNGRNSCVCPDVPVGLALELATLQEDDEYIDDVQLTEDGCWLILYGDNGFVWEELDPDLEQQLREYNDEAEVVTSVAFNDQGEWIVISSDHVSASSDELTEWIQEGIEKFGQLWTAHMTDDAVMLCFENGYRYRGDVPENLLDTLRETDIDVYRVKFTSDGCYFIADVDGTYDYYM